MRRAAALVLFVLLSAGCNSPTEPEVQLPRGRLSGSVTIGPNCPGPQQCPTPPSAYRERNVLVYTLDRSRLLFTVDIDSTGFYFIDLGVGSYQIDLRRTGADTSADVPRTIEIRASQVTRVDIRIDTGIR